MLHLTHPLTSSAKHITPKMLINSDRYLPPLVPPLRLPLVPPQLGRPQAPRLYARLSGEKPDVHQTGLGIRKHLLRRDIDRTSTTGLRIIGLVRSRLDHVPPRLADSHLRLRSLHDPLVRPGKSSSSRSSTVTSRADAGVHPWHSCASRR